MIWEATKEAEAGESDVGGNFLIAAAIDSPGIMPRFHDNAGLELGKRMDEVYN